MSYTPPNPNGQATNANSAPVTLSTEQDAKIDLLATKAKQDLLLAELELKANLTDTQPVSIAGSVTVNSGTNLNTSALSLEATQLEVRENTEKGSESTLNTSIIALNNGATFTGTAEQNDFPDVFVVCKTDQSGILYFDFSVDGTNFETFPSTGFSVSANIQEVHKAIKASLYFRVRFTNNSGFNQTFLRLYTYYGNFDQLNSPLTSTPSTYSDAVTTKSVIVGQTDGGMFKFVGVDENGNLKTSVENPKTAFNELLIASPTPVAQISFEYGINTQVMTTAVTGTGTATTANSLLSVSTGVSASSSSQLISRRYLKYRAGQGAVGRFTMLFTAGVANSKQYAGLGNASLTDGFGFGYSGVNFGLFHINNSSETFVSQSSWNVDTLDGTDSSSNPSGMLFDPTKGNVGQIKYQYLGFGCIYYYVEHDTDGEFTLVHVLKYPNSNTVTSLANPSLNLIWRVENTSNTSNVVLKAGSGALFVEGDIKTLGAKNATDNSKGTITTLTNILTLRNATTYNTVVNRGQIRIKGVSVAYDGGNGVATLQVILNTTLGGTPSFTTINGTTVNQGVTITNGQSVASFDIAGTTITGGTVLFNTTLARLNNQYIDLSNLDIFISPTETLTFAMKATTSGTCAVAVNWVEDI